MSKTLLERTAWASLSGDDPTVDVLTVGALVVAGDVTPTNLATNQSDFDPGAAGVLRLALDGDVTIDGFAGGARGRLLTVVNTSAHTLTLAGSGGTSADANKLKTPGGADVVLTQDQECTLRYDSTDLRWRVS